MKIKSQRDFWSGVLFVLVGLGFAGGALQYEFGTSARPGPGYFPLMLGIIQAILGLGVIAKALITPTVDGEPIGKVAWRPLLVVVASIVMFGALMPRLGLICTVPLLVVMVSFAGDKIRPIGTGVTAVVLTAGAWFIFIWGLKLNLPVWPTFLSA